MEWLVGRDEHVMVEVEVEVGVVVVVVVGHTSRLMVGCQVIVLISNLNMDRF